MEEEKSMHCGDLLVIHRPMDLTKDGKGGGRVVKRNKDDPQFPNPHNTVVFFFLILYISRCVFFRVRLKERKLITIVGLKKYSKKYKKRGFHMSRKSRDFEVSSCLSLVWEKGGIPLCVSLQSPLFKKKFVYKEGEEEEEYEYVVVSLGVFSKRHRHTRTLTCWEK